MLPRPVVTALGALQAVAAAAVGVLGVVTVVVGRRQNARGGTFADLVTVVGVLLAVAGVGLAVGLWLALRAWRRGSPGGAAFVVLAEGFVLVVGGWATLQQTRFWLLPVSALVTALAVLLSRRPDGGVTG
jgi:hypothetical protein